MTQTSSPAANGATAIQDSERGPRAILLAVLVLALALVYGRALFGGYVYDDIRLVLQNPRLVSIEGVLEGLRTPYWSFDEPMAAGQLGYWRPLTVLALALGRWIGGDSAFGHHWVSLLLHLGASLAAWRFASRLTRSTLWGGVAALLFALHPVQVEAVAWTSAVNDPLFALLGLLSLSSWIAWRRRGSAGLPLAAAGWLALALLAKEQALVLPLLCVVLDLGLYLLPTKGSSAAQRELPLARSYVPLAAVLVLYAAVRVAVFDEWTAGFARPNVDFPLTAWRAVTYRLELLGGFISLLVWPAELKVFRGFRPVLPEGDPTLWIAGGWVLLWAAALAVAWRRGMRVPRTLLLLVPVALLPVLGPLEAVGSYPLSDRYLYLPVAFFSLFLVLVARRILPERLGLAALALVAVAYGLRGSRHARIFEDDLTFSRAAVEASPRVPSTHWNLGRVLLERYRVERDPELLQEAFVHFLRSLALGTDHGEHGPRVAPDAPVEQQLEDMQRVILNTPAKARRPDPTVFVEPWDRLQANLGQGWCYLYLSELQSERDLTTPLKVFQEIARLFPNSELARLGLGVTHLERGELDEAELVLGQAVALNELNPESWYGLGEALRRKEQWEAARNAYQRALRLRPRGIQDIIGIVTCAIEEGRYEIAELRLAQARERAPEAIEPRFWSGMLAARQGDFPDALAWFERALAIDERYGRAHLEKARALLHLGERQAAVRSLSLACELMPESFDAHYNLGSLLDQAGEAQVALRYLKRAYELSESDALRDRLHVRIAQILAEDPAGTLGMARAAEANGDYEAALDWVERAIERDEPMSRDATAHYLRGRYLQLLGRLEEAAAAFKESLRFDEARLWTQHDLGLLLAGKLGRPTEAEPHLRRALELLETTELQGEGLRKAVRENLVATLEGREREKGPLLPPIEARGVEDR